MKQHVSLRYGASGLLVAACLAATLRAGTMLSPVLDGWEEELPALTAFILPGGSPVGAFLHAARTVCRRAERAIVALQADDLPDTVIPYVNRLSDWLFVCARLVNRRAGVEERIW